MGWLPLVLLGIPTLVALLLLFGYVRMRRSGANFASVYQQMMDLDV